jgi:hypothetical protein
MAIRPTFHNDWRHIMTPTQLGKIVLEAYGSEACIKAYDTDYAPWVGITAFGFGDIEGDGTLT